MPKKPDYILQQWGVTDEEFTELVKQTPSLRGVLVGYIAEMKFHKAYLHHPDVTEAQKDDDHDRTKKGDRRIVYRGHTFLIEVKSLQTNSVKKLSDDTWIGKAQVDASDRRDVTFPDGTKLNTTCLLRGEFDLLAVNCFAFGEEYWRFAFILESELPPNKYPRYTTYQRAHLLPSSVTVNWPLQPPFSDNPFTLLDRLIEGKSARTSHTTRTLWDLDKD